MTVALAGTATAIAAALAGLTLAGLFLARRSPPRLLQFAHPVAGITALVLVYVAVTAWHGPRDLPLDAGALVLALVFLGGGLLFALRLSRLPRPWFAVALHGGAALLACVLLVIGLVRARGGV